MADSTTNALTPDLAGHRVVLDELRREFDKLFASADVLDGKGQGLFAATGILIAIAGLGRAAILQTAVTPLFLAGVGIVIALYLAMYLTLFVMLRPRSFTLPMSLDWEVQADRYFGEAEHTVNERLIVDYVQVIDVARAILAAKSRALRWSAGLFLAIVCLLLASLVVPVA